MQSNIILNQLRELCDFVNNNKQYVRYQDIDYIGQYVLKAFELLEQGLFEDDKVEQLATADWGEFNFRYGINSIKGFYGEVIVVVLSNKRDKNCTVSLCPENKEMQLKGRDVCIASPIWRKEYYGQVKVSKNNDGTITLYRKYFEYDRQYVDRIYFVFFGEGMIRIDYPYFLDNFNDEEIITFKRLVLDKEQDNAHVHVYTFD